MVLKPVGADDMSSWRYCVAGGLCCWGERPRENCGGGTEAWWLLCSAGDDVSRSLIPENGACDGGGGNHGRDSEGVELAGGVPWRGADCVRGQGCGRCSA